MLTLLVSRAWAQGSFQGELTAEQYYFHALLGHITMESRNEGQTSGLYRTPHGSIPFTVGQAELEAPGAKLSGAKLAVEHLLAFLANRSSTQSGEPAFRLLEELTGLRATPDEWRDWYELNRERLDWSEREQRLVVDADPQSAGISDEGYCQRHPWKKRN
jgi:hypothetical protein